MKADGDKYEVLQVANKVSSGDWQRSQNVAIFDTSMYDLYQ